MKQQNRGEKPTLLNETNKTKYDGNGFVKRFLLDMSDNECSFCDCKITPDNIEIEHIHPKVSHPELIATWNNMISICRGCNSYKSSEDPSSLYIDPSSSNDHDVVNSFRVLSTGRIIPKSDSDEFYNRAKYMINIYALNRETLISERREILEKIRFLMLKKKLSKEDVVYLTRNTGYSKLVELYSASLNDLIKGVNK